MQRGSRCAAILLLILGNSACRPGGESAPVSPRLDPAPAGTPVAQPAPAAEPLASPGPEWAPSRPPRRYVGTDLFNHIDGGADYFLELGFREVTVQRYANGPATLTHEVYEMKDPTAARAVYLRFRGKGKPIGGVAGRNAGDRYQIMAQQDRYFVQVTNGSGDESCLPAMTNLVNQTLASVPQDGDVTLLELLPADGLIADSEVIVCGPYSLQNVFTLGEGDVLQLQAARCGVAGDYVTEREGSFTRLIVAYDSAEAAQAAFRHVVAGLDPQLQVVQGNESAAVFRDSKGMFGSVTAHHDRLDICLHLVRVPNRAEPRR